MDSEKLPITLNYEPKPPDLGLIVETIIFSVGDLGVKIWSHSVQLIHEKLTVSLVICILIVLLHHGDPEIGSRSRHVCSFLF